MGQVLPVAVEVPGIHVRSDSPPKTSRRSRAMTSVEPKEARSAPQTLSFSTESADCGSFTKCRFRPRAASRASTSPRLPKGQADIRVAAFRPLERSEITWRAGDGPAGCQCIHVRQFHCQLLRLRGIAIPSVANVEPFAVHLARDGKKFSNEDRGPVRPRNLGCTR